MRKRRQIELFSISFLDLLSGALGAVIILYVAIPKNKSNKQDVVTEMIQKELTVTRTELQKVKMELAESNQKLSKAEIKKAVDVPVPSLDGAGANLDIGFKFKGKNIVFLIDTSYSMNEEDRMGQVKAGIKMLITALPANYKIEIVQFPFSDRAPFKSLWGTTMETNARNKMDAFDYIYTLRPSGGTPTRDALMFVLENYEGISDIVLLTDGAPTFHNSNKKDDIYDIATKTYHMNQHQIQINTIGVGSDFIKDKNSERYQFLEILSSQNKGFFVGF